jgi:hypothetical protein
MRTGRDRYQPHLSKLESIVGDQNLAVCIPL